MDWASARSISPAIDLSTPSSNSSRQSAPPKRLPVIDNGRWPVAAEHRRGGPGTLNSLTGNSWWPS